MAYNETTTVKGKQITLTSEEQLAVEKFHTGRLAFAILNDGRCAINAKDPREHKVYLQEDFGISAEEFDTLIRGYIKTGRIVFYKTLDFIPVEAISKEILDAVSEKALEFFGAGKYEIWNGLKVGKLGQEWPPIQIRGIVSVNPRQNVIVPQNDDR
jgi:hypothetical protein